MKNLNCCIFVTVCLLSFACKKETNPVIIQSSTDAAASLLTSKLKWLGTFLSYNGLPASRSVPDRMFIRDGSARIYSDSIQIDEHNYYSTGIRLLLPASANVNGDSLTVEVGLKNPFASSFYSPYYGRDITIYLKGETNEVAITNTATSDIDPGAAARAGLKIGRTVRYNLPLFQYNFEDYGSLVLQTFNRGLAGYRNNEYLGGLAYQLEPPVGRLTEMGIIFKGSGFVDYIKIYNSANSKLLMSEEFNTDGKSTIIIW